MRKILAAVVAVPFIAVFYLSSVIRRISPVKMAMAGPAQLVVVGAAVGLLVSGLLLGLPARQVAGGAPPTFAALAPQGDGQRTGTNLPFDAPFQVKFTKPMNEATVQNALTLTPQANVTFQWDATAQVVSLAPNPHWQPNTTYLVDIGGGATDQQGLRLANEVHTSFDSGAPTSGTITATQKGAGLVSPMTTFQITFTRPVKLSTVLTHIGIVPQVAFDLVGDDPTDAASQVFTLTPRAQLASNTSYQVSLTDGGTDSAGAALQPVPTLVAHTMTAPAVVRFRPQDGTASYDTNQPVSVRFTMAMDEKSTAAAFSVTVNGAKVAGSTYWAENDTVLVLTPRSSFKVGNTVVARVSTAARSAEGMHLASAASATFKVSAPRSTVLSYGAGKASASAPYYASEIYYMSLMNCTRTGKWVTSSGACSTETHHTLPAQSPLTYSARISNLVSRPYAKYMADHRLFIHEGYHDAHWRLCNWGGYCGNSFGENIAWPTSSGRSGMIAVEIYYQNEYWCRCEHYYNIMASWLHQAGVGVWVSGGNVRVSIDFYG
ncbi:MAG: Ig-like domain-containing protein [Candidatus Limnocylindrales bacterium]